MQKKEIETKDCVLRAQNLHNPRKLYTNKVDGAWDVYPLKVFPCYQSCYQNPINVYHYCCGIFIVSIRDEDTISMME